MSNDPLKAYDVVLRGHYYIAWTTAAGDAYRVLTAVKKGSRSRVRGGYRREIWRIGKPIKGIAAEVQACIANPDYAKNMNATVALIGGFT